MLGTRALQGRLEHSNFQPAHNITFTSTNLITTLLLIIIININTLSSAANSLRRWSPKRAAEAHGARAQERPSSSPPSS